MARSRPALMTLVLSATAVLGYAAYRTLEPGAPEPAAPVAESPSTPDAPAAREPVDVLPDVSIANLDGEPQSLRSWPGKPMVINFWATWCAPCLREIPMLKDLQTTRPDVQILGIAIDRPDRVAPFAADMQFNYPILVGQSEAWAAAAALGVDIFALPFTIFTAADGHILGVHTGELHAEHLENFKAVADDLAGNRIALDEARARIARRM